MLKIFTKKDNRTNLEKEIDRVTKILERLSPDSDGYTKIVDNLEKLRRANVSERNRFPSPDTIATLACGFAELWLILNYEKVGVITSKALGFVSRGRI